MEFKVNEGKMRRAAQKLDDYTILFNFTKINYFGFRWNNFLRRFTFLFWILDGTLITEAFSLWGILSIEGICLFSMNWRSDAELGK